MQSNEEINTSLPQNELWVLYDKDGSNYKHSKAIEHFAETLEMQLRTLVPILEKTGNGRWPVQITGKLLKVTSLTFSSGQRLLTVEHSTPEEASEILQEITGDPIYILSTSSGKVVALSEKADKLFRSNGSMSSIFDSSSTGAVQAALRNCVRDGFVPEFLVSCTEDNGQRINYGITMRRLPAPGRLVYCRLSVPSVAVVTGTLDRNSLISVLLEENFCPSITVDTAGVITSLNRVAKSICKELWDTDPTGIPFFDLVHPDQQKAMILRHEQRVKGYAVPSRFQVKLRSSTSGITMDTEISVVPLHNLDRWVVFIRPVTPDGGFSDGTGGNINDLLRNLFVHRDLTPEEIIMQIANLLKADAIAYVSDSGLITAGDSRELLEQLDRSSLAAAKTGFAADSNFIYRIESDYGVTHLVISGLQGKEIGQFEQDLLHLASGMLKEYQVRTALREERKIISLMKEMGAAYLNKTETLEGLLADYAKGCGAETAVVFGIGRKGGFLRGIAGAGIVGELPDLQLGTLNTASWACLRGETAFYTDSPENDLRFARVFPESLTELAVPFFNGSTPDGVILIASTEKERFSRSAAELTQLLALLFTVPERASAAIDQVDFGGLISPVNDLAAGSLIHQISALKAAALAKAGYLRNGINGDNELSANLDELLESVNWLSFYSTWTLWYLKTSLFEGKPDQKWIDPSPLLEKVLEEFGRFSRAKDIELKFIPPESDLEVCTDGAFVSMIAHSLLVCILSNCPECTSVSLSLKSTADHWTFTLDCKGSSIPGECLSMQRLPDSKNTAFVLAWKLTEDLGGTVSTFSSRGKSTRMVVRLRISG